ncbi:Isy1-like splicing [Corchorus capsularis]|uniref:Isy1-like splicing n=1 Tax=Corchorus capsularis TaxID=210143 RepID=A0A1R3IVY3_COCAP|nr:Isy1-like splicing [Corchorus capsularis]
MARNEEKARSELNRFVAQKAAEKKKPKERRPYLASQCRNLAEADKWRNQIMTEIGRKVTDIQNEGLGEHRLRDLNDEINKLLREKSHWERRIVELGGPNHAKHAPKMTDLEGNIIDVPNPSGRGPGYRYFGAAKKLPGVRELFEKPVPELRKRKSGYDNYKRIDASYYGYNRDEVEGEAEEEWRRKEAKEVVTAGAAAAAREVLFEEEKEREFVKKKKKMELLSKYASQELLEEQSEAKDMLKIHR